MPRQARLDSPGTLHHVIARGIEKRRIENNREDREDFVSRLGEIAIDTQTAIYAWALMPNHAHILLRSGPKGLSAFMRRLLTGYAVGYNLRHRRHGHLFQNRYKSIVCEEDSYFTELVRYIHLNPLRGMQVEDMHRLDRYPWCGHGVLMGTKKHIWQDRDYVLAWFGSPERAARKAYRQYVSEGISEGRRSDLVGGGLVRSAGGWSEVLSLRKSREKILSDERVLGGSDFVAEIRGDADRWLKHQLTGEKRREEAGKLIMEICKEKGINIEELRAGSRRGSIPRVRAQLALQMVEEYGLPLAEVGRQVGVSTSAVCRILSRKNKSKST